MSQEKTPSNPSRSATARVKNPIPVPEICPYCNGKVECLKNSEVYNGKEYGDWPWVYVCENRDAYVGLHPFTAMPLGTLANEPLRLWRSKAKKAFYGWAYVTGIRDRKISYPILAEKMGIPLAEAHFGWFDLDRCKQAFRIFTDLVSDQKAS